MTLDPAALQVLISRLTGVAEEMGSVLRRAAYSPNIKERADCSAALFTADGTLLVQAEHIPVHLGSMPAAVRAAIDAFPEGLAPGEQVILNDPFAGGTHLNDVTLVAPVFAAGGMLVGWAANRAHHADLGGMAPGSMPPEATEIFQEGFRIPPVRCTPEIEAVFAAASRTPEERRGDLDAQKGANRVGVARLLELAEAPFAEVIDYGERRMRAALRALQPGTYAFTDRMDSTGGPAGAEPARVAVTVTIADDTIVFDFSESDDQRPGTVNAVEAVTVSAVAFAIRSVTDPTIPANGGALRPVRVLTRPGSIVSARPPVAVGAGNVEVSQRVADVCLGALAAAAPARVGAASQGTMNNTLVGGNGWVYYETVGGGQGGRPGPRPGMSGVHTAMTNTQDTPVEALERAYAMRVRRYGLRRGSGGRGLAPGGDGIVRELEMLEAVTVSLVTERRMSRPWGLAGGAPGASGENWLLHEADEARAERLPDKCTIRMDPGDVVRVLTPGGGGWGIDPFVAGLDAYDARTPEEARDRDRVRTLADTSDPFSRDTALHLTGSAVVVHPPTRRVLLRWHVRMQGWLQVGGHGDAGERDPFVVARREAREETGLTDLRSWPPAARPAVVHVVVVPVPAWRGDPAHEHADVRYVFATDEPDAAIPESIGTPLRWLDIDAAIAEVRDNLRVTLERVRALLDTDVS